MPHFAANRGIDYTWGEQIQSGSGLTDQWANHLNGISPELAEPTPFDVAVTQGAWDALVFQPFGHRAVDETTAINQFLGLALANPLNSNASLYVYAPAPTRADDGSTTFTTHWLAPYDGGVVNYESTRAYYRTVYNAVKADHGDHTVGMIPAGDAWAAVAAKIDAGTFPGATNSSELYRDSLHASMLGQLTSVATFYSVVLKQDPRGLQLNWWGFYGFPQEQIEPVFQTVWDVVRAESAITHVLTPGDSTGDGVVNFNDLLTLAQHFGTSKGNTWFSGDFDDDGVVNFGDLLALAQNFTTGQPTTGDGLTPSFAADWALTQSLVPEPTISIVALVMPLLTARRRSIGHGNEQRSSSTRGGDAPA